MKAWFLRYWPWLAAALSGLMLAACFAPINWGSLVWVALCPLIAAVWFSNPWSRFEWLRLFLLGYVTGVFYFVGSLHWLWTVTVPGWLLLGAYLAVYPAIWAVFLGLVAKPRASDDAGVPVWFNSRANLLAAVLAAGSWVALEWVRGWLFTGFGWNTLAVALVENLPLIQFADITGAAGISFLLVMVNITVVATAVRLPLEIQKRKMRAHYDFSLTVVLVAAAFAYGARILLSPMPETTEISFAAIQANVPIVEKRDPRREEEILDLHRRLSETVIAFNPDLLIWPEAATPQPAFLNQRDWDVVRSVAEKHAGDFLFGTVHYEERGDFNSAALLSNRGTAVQWYHKMHLVPFGEYVPLRKSFPLFAWIVGDVVPDDFDFGPSLEVLELSVKPVRIAALICFEDTVPYLPRDFAMAGAQLFVTLTNNAWFLKSAGSEQHRANAVLRTVENRRPMIRAANTGVTCAFDIRGRETHRLEEDDGNTFFEGFLLGKVDVPVNPSPTFYTLNGNWFSMGCIGLSLLACLWRLPRRKV